MTRKEMIERAIQIRSRDLYGKVDREELDSLTAIQKLIEIPVSGGSVPVFQIISEKRSSNSGMIINFHGGGFMKGRQDKDRVFCSRMAEKFNALVWDVDYSLAPENPFPKAVDEAYQVVKYAFEHSKELEVDTNRIFLIGHSAGGNLAVTVCMKAGETREFQPKGLIAEFFPTDLYTDPVLKTRIEGDMPAETARIEATEKEEDSDFYYECIHKIPTDSHTNPIEYHADCYGFGIYLDEDKLEETSDQVLRVTLPSEL